MDNKEARMRMLYLANLISVPMALYSAVKLKIPELVWQGGANLPLSPKQLTALIQARLGLEPHALSLERVLRVLASHGVFEEVPDGGDPNAKAFRLTQVGQTLVPDDQGLSLGAYILRNYQDAFVQIWPHLYESLLDPTEEAFKKAHGVPVYEYYATHSACNLLLQGAMSSIGVPFMKALLDSYDGFESEELKTIVDVGGCSGSCVAMIVQQYPGLKGINFDLPGVVADAPQYEGVTHIGGDMFDYVPAGDAIFIKGVLCSYKDEEFKKVLENCHKALPEKGKLIFCDTVLPEATDESARARMLMVADIFLLTLHGAKGWYRTESGYRKLCESAGFTFIRAVYDFDHFATLMEFQK